MNFPETKIKNLHVTNTLDASKRGARYEIHFLKSELNITACNEIARKVFDIYLRSNEPCADHLMQMLKYCDI